MVSMPSLEGKLFNYALDVLERNHLQLGDTIYRPDFMKGAIIEQRYKGSRITPGTKLQWGSFITLVISGGLDQSNMVVPDLTGLTYRDAKAQLDSLGLLLNPVPDPGVKDTLGAFIYKQNPTHFDEDNKLRYIKAGMFMDIWLSPVMITPVDSTTQQ